MNFLIYLLFGYKEYCFKKDDILNLYKICQKNNFAIKQKSARVKIPLYKCKRFENILRGKLEFTASEGIGLFAYALKNLKNIPLIISTFIIAFLWYFSSLMVWDIRVSGNENVESELIIEELSRVGFQKGVFWHNVNKSELELSFLKNSKTVSWININRIGTVAYVRVVDKLENKVEVPTGYCSLVAASDGVIEELTVRRGRAVVKVGDTVKAGQLLVSGILADGSFTYADASVMARKSENVSVSVSKKYVINEPQSEKLSTIKINFFNKSINILKMGGNLDEKCDIIQLYKSFSFLGRELPISYQIEKIKISAPLQAEYSSDEMVVIARENLNKMLEEKLLCGNLISITTGGDFDGEVYKMWASISYSENIASALPFYTE
jgi:sporulation protein YqfD